MPGKEDIVRLKHMLEASQDAISFTRGKTRKSLDTDKMLVHSLVRCLEIVGEAASRSSRKCQDDYPEIRWKSIIGMRNWLIHAYYDINPDTVWKTVSEDLPPLVAELEKIIRTAGQGGLGPPLQ